MSFTIFEQSTTAYANEVNDNFYHVAQGHLLPRGGDSLTSTNAVYDLGTTTAIWNNLFCNTLHINDSVTSGGNIWQLLNTVNLTTTESTIDLVPAGFSGDNYQEIKILVNCYLTGGGISIFYGDSLGTTNYFGWQGFGRWNFASGLTTVAMRYTSLTGIYIGGTELTITTKYVFAEINLNTKTGIQRNLISSYLAYVNSTTIISAYDVAGTWEGTATITAIYLNRLAAGGTTGVYFQPGSRFELWGRK
jgi:hypothetical protein